MPPGRRPRRPGLDVWMNGLRVGRWTHTPSQGHRFLYAPGWLAAPNRRPLSLSLPLVSGHRPLQGEPVRAFFDNLLPENVAVRKRWRLQLDLADSSPFDLLTALGRDCAGAIQLLPAGSPPPEVQSIAAEPLSEDDVVALLERAARDEPPAGRAAPELRFALPGAQEKLALLWHEDRWCVPQEATPSSHILKLPLGADDARKAAVSTSLENEWLCSRILHAYGLPVAASRIERFGEWKALVIERFDRRRVEGRDGPRWVRLPMEDLCQATATRYEERLESDGGPGIERILTVLRGADQAAADRETFLTAQLVYWMLAAPEGHAKNFSLLLKEGGRFALAPCYDVLSAWPLAGEASTVLRQRLRLPMAIGPERHVVWKDIVRRDWNAAAKRAAMGVDFEAVITRIIDATPGVIDVVSAQLPEGFPESVAKRIFRGLRESAEVLGEKR